MYGTYIDYFVVGGAIAVVFYCWYHFARTPKKFR